MALRVVIALLIVAAGLLYRQLMVAGKVKREISQKNEMLSKMAAENDWLLKELHHRVKNNLHTVICLLESQAQYLQDDALKAVEDSQHRIFAMSLIHQKLYKTEHVDTIDMTEYIPELVNNLQTDFGVEGFISFAFDIDPVTLNISYALPLGLIINEAVTNSIKYAFPVQKSAEIQISLTGENQLMILQIRDNGIGLRGDPLLTEYQSMGIELMKGLSAEINASIKFENLKGTRITISFLPSKQFPSGYHQI